MNNLSSWRRFNFLRAVQVDIQRAVFSRRFFITVGLILAWLIINGATYIFVYKSLYDTGIPYIFEDAMTGKSGIGMIVLSIATVPYSTSYLMDASSGFDHHAIGRVGFSAYAFARVITVALSAFFAMVTAAGVFLAGLCLSGAPLDTIPGNGATFNGTYTDLVIQVGPWLYFVVRFFISGITAAMASVFALYTTKLISNVYVSLVAPLILYYGWDAMIAVIHSLSGGTLKLSTYFALINNIVFQVNRNNGFSFIWASAFLLTLTTLFGRGYIRRLRKEQGL